MTSNNLPAEAPNALRLQAKQSIRKHKFTLIDVRDVLPLKKLPSTSDFSNLHSGSKVVCVNTNHVPFVMIVTEVVLDDKIWMSRDKLGNVYKIACHHIAAVFQTKEKSS